MGPPPVVTGISPKEGPPGTRVTIRGEFLGSTATDLIGLKICGCDCLLSAEWKSKNKIVARSGPCKGRGDIIVTTKFGGVGTSTVQFRGYHESVGPVKESAVWVEEAAPPALPWGRRPMSPTAYTPPDPLGLSTEGDECKFPEEELRELFPDGSGNLSDENFVPGWYLLEHHSNTSYEDLKAGMVFLQRKVESQKEGQLSFLKANTGAVMDQLDRLVLLKNMFEEDKRKNGKEPLPSLQAAIEESITLADSLFSEILTRKENADKTREALALLTRHKFLFQLPANIDKNVKKKDYDLVVNDYARVKNLFGNTDVKLFQKILAVIDKKIDDLKEKLHTRITTMPINIQDQRKYIRLLISLNWEGDAAWSAIVSRHEYLIKMMNKVKEHFKQKEEQENADKGKRKCREPEPECSGEGGEGGDGGEWSSCPEWPGTEEWSLCRASWCATCSVVVAREVAALWPLARWYWAGELAGAPALPQRQETFKQMIIEAMEAYSGQMRSALFPSGGVGSGAGSGVGGVGGVGTAGGTAMRARLLANLDSMRETLHHLIKLDLPTQPLSIVEKVIYDYRVHGMTVFLQRTLKQVKALVDKETWKIEEFSDYGAITNLPQMLEGYLNETLSTIHKYLASGGRRELPLLTINNDAASLLHRHTQQILLAYNNVLHTLALQHSDQEFTNTSLSVTLDQQLDETLPNCSGTKGRGPSWQQRLLITGNNAQYTRKVILLNIAATFESYEFPKPALALQAAKDALSTLESTIAETYLEHKGDPLVGTIEPSMYMGRHKIADDAIVEDARPYVYEIINNLIAVHAEVDSVCGSGGGGGATRYVRDICETVCEELARLAAAGARGREGGAATAGAGGAAAFQARLEYTILHFAAGQHLTRKAENYLMEAVATIPPLKSEEEKKRMDMLLEKFKKRMRLQLASLTSNMEIV